MWRYPLLQGGLPLRTARAIVLAELCNTITCQLIELESYSNPLRIQQSSSLDWNFFRFGFSLGDIIMGTSFHFATESTWPWAPTQWGIFGLKFFWNLVYHLRLIGSLGSKIMAQKPKISKNSTPTNANPGYILLMAITTRQSIKLGSCSNPLEVGVGLIVCIEKKNF